MSRLLHLRRGRRTAPLGMPCGWLQSDTPKGVPPPVFCAYPRRWRHRRRHHLVEGPAMRRTLGAALAAGALALVTASPSSAINTVNSEPAPERTEVGAVVGL